MSCAYILGMNKHIHVVQEYMYMYFLLGWYLFIHCKLLCGVQLPELAFGLQFFCSIHVVHE